MKKRGFRDKKQFRLLGHHVFSLGLLLVLFFTVYNPIRLSPVTGTLLLILGIIVGLFDIPQDREHHFIVAMLGIMLVGGVVNFSAISYKLGSTTVGIYIRALLGNVSVFLSSTIIILGFKVIYRIYRQSK